MANTIKTIKWRLLARFLRNNHQRVRSRRNKSKYVAKKTTYFSFPPPAQLSIPSSFFALQLVAVSQFVYADLVKAPADFRKWRTRWCPSKTTKTWRVFSSPNTHGKESELFQLTWVPSCLCFNLQIQKNIFRGFRRNHHLQSFESRSHKQVAVQWFHFIAAAPGGRQCCQYWISNNDEKRGQDW